MVHPKSSLIDDNDAYSQWVWKILNFEGGLLEYLIAFLTLAVTLIFGWYGAGLFPPGRYPRMVLAAPGLFSGGLFLWGATYVIWNHRNK